MAGLYGVPQAVAIFPQFIANQPETLVLKEHVMSLSGDSFSIKLANGTPILQVEGKVRYGNGGFADLGAVSYMSLYLPSC
jgi:hypothetical protein